MIISVINHTDGEISDEDVHTALRAINRQIAYDFQPYWSIGATLRLEGKSAKQPDGNDLRDMRGDAVLYLWNKKNVDDALGFHEANNRGVPFGFVFTALSTELGESWTVTLSHEALETIADPEVNLLVQGPHPSEAGRDVFYWYEMCDAVQDEAYTIDGIEVSNFVLPLYFTGQHEMGSRNDYLGRAAKPLPSFGINDGGYVGYFDPALGEHTTVSKRGDRRAAERLKVKQQFKGGRRANRYERFVAKAPKPAAADAPSPASRRAQRTSVARPAYVPCPEGIQVIGKGEDDRKP
jgi:hypothetical protein